MITLNASGGSVTFTFSGNSTYLNDGTITVPVNSLALIIDESDFVTFKKSHSNDIFVSANIAEFGMTKAELESWFKENAVGSTGGGGKAIEAGRGISVATGETADTVSFNLPISAGTGVNSVKIGNSSNVASALFSYAEGNITTASSQSSHAEGDQTLANGVAAHAEGFSTSAAAYSHTEGMQTLANGEVAHAEGYKTSATSVYSHAEGYRTITNNECEHASGQYNVSSSGSSDFGDSGNTLFSVGNGANNNSRHNAFEIRQNGDIYLSLNGQDIKLQDQLGGSSSSLPISAGTGTNSVIVGASWNVASNSYSYAEGSSTTASGKYAHAEGSGTKASGTTSHAEGNATSATTEDAHAEGNSTLASGRKSHAEGHATSATSNSSHAEGFQTLSSSWASHAEGSSTITSGDSSHAEGQLTLASGSYSHAEGDQTIASGSASHAEGQLTLASGDYSHAEGGSTSATSLFSHAEGYYTTTKNRVEHASGQYNVSNKASITFGDSGNTLFSVGNGTADNARHNVFEIRQNGDIYFFDGTNDVKLQDVISNILNRLTTIENNS